MSIRLLFAILNLILSILCYYLRFKGNFSRKVMGGKKTTDPSQKKFELYKEFSFLACEQAHV